MTTKGTEMQTIATLADELKIHPYGLAEFAAEVLGGRSQADPLTDDEAELIREAWLGAPDFGD